MWGTAFRADAVFGDVTGLALVALYRLDDHAVSLAIVVDETFPGPAVLMVLELREDVGLELLVIRRLCIIGSKLFQRDIFGDESHQPCDLCVKIMDFIDE